MEDLSEFAPRILTIYINPSKIGEVIGPGGKVIRALVEETGAKIDIEDDGKVLIASVDAAAGQAALERIQGIVEEAEVGRVYDGKVTRITDHGAIVQILPGADGLVHISELAIERIDTVESVCSLGDMMKVKVLAVEGDRVRLSRKAVLIEADGGTYVPAPVRSSRGSYNDRRGGRGGPRRR